MAVVNLTEQDIQKQFDEFKRLQRESSRLAKSATEATVGAEGFSEEMLERLRRGEISPELRRRERGALAELFAAPRELERRFEDIPIRPTELGNIIAGRMETYLTQLDGIRNQRKARAQRIDDIIKSGATKAKAEATKLALGLEQKREETRAAERQFEFLFSARQNLLKRLEGPKPTATEKAIEDARNRLLAARDEFGRVDFNTYLTIRSENPLSTTEFDDKFSPVYLDRENQGFLEELEFGVGNEELILD